MDTFGIIDTMLARPYLFTGGESLSALRYFLGGYNFCRMESVFFLLYHLYRRSNLPFRHIEMYIEGETIWILL